MDSSNGVLLSHDTMAIQSPQRATSHDQKQPLGRRRDPRKSHFSSSSSLIFTITLLLCCCTLTAAEYLKPLDSLPAVIGEPRPLSSQDIDSTLSELADTAIVMASEEQEPQELRRRATNPTSSAAHSTARPSPTSSSVTTDPTDSAALVLPTAFDGSGIGQEFTTATCPSYINSFLQDSTFISCLPVSLLIDTSVAFFRAEQSLPRITQVLEAACAVNATRCNEHLTTIASNLTSPDVCGPDLKNSIAVVKQIQTALLAYSTMYTATCLKTNATNSYCFADAITNATSPTDSYVYFLPLNQTLVGGTKATCNQCLQSTMSVFQVAAANRTSTVSSVYSDSAKLINGLCGPGFVNSTIPNPQIANGAGRTVGSMGSMLLGLAVLAFVL